MWLQHTKLLILAVALMILSGCMETGFPREALEGVISPRIAFTLWERTISTAEGGYTIEIVEVRRMDDRLERRAIVRLPYGQRYLGPLTPVCADVPVELLLTDIAGEAVLIGWVDRSVSGEPTMIELRRAIGATEQPIKATKTVAVESRGMAIPIGADEAANWLQLVQIAVQSRPASAENELLAPTEAVSAIFDPPVFIGARFLGLEYAGQNQVELTEGN